MVNSSHHHRSNIKLKCTILFILNGLYLKFSLLSLSTVVLFDQPAFSAVPDGRPKAMSIMNQKSNPNNNKMLSDASEHPFYLVAEEEGKAILPCNMSKPINDTIDLILWFRGDAETALYSLDARKASIQKAKHFPSDDLSPRAYIDITGRPTSLIIDPVKAGDAGEYRCRIDFRKGPSHYKIIHLDIIVPPKEVIVMDEYGQRLRDPVGPFNEGAHLTVICESEGGKPIPWLSWWKNDVLLDNTSVLTPQGVVRNELVITRLDRNDDRSILSCKASNSNQTKPVTSSITLELNLRPLDVKIMTSRRPIVAGQPIEVTCQSSGARPPAIVTWWKGSKRLIQTTESVTDNENITISIVQFTPSIDDHGKILSCRADHVILPDSALEDSWELNVYYTPKLSISFGASIHHDQVNEGSNVSLECHIQSNPSVSDVKWKFNGKLIVNDIPNENENSDIKSGLATITQNTLFLTEVTRFNSGKYKCTAANSEGEGESDDVHLKVHFAPVCKPNQRTLFGVAKLEPIKVPCEVESDPKNLIFKWQFDNLQNNSKIIDLTTFQVIKTKSILTYAPRTNYGYGKLYCWAENRIGKQKEPCVFRIVPAGTPEIVRNCLVGNQSLDSLVVKCEPGNDGGLEQSFYLEIYQSNGHLQSNWSSSKEPIFQVAQLPVGTSFVLVLYSANSKGRSNLVTLTASTLPFNSNDAGFKPVIYILVAAIGILVIAATVILVISKVRASNSDNNKGPHYRDKRKSSIENANEENQRRYSNQNGGIQMDAMYTKEYPCSNDIDLNNYNETWEHQINSEKYINYHDGRVDSGCVGFLNDVGHVALAYEHRITPEGDAYIERSASDSTSTMSSNVIPKEYTRINRGLISPNILPANHRFISEDDSSETPLMNGIYYSSIKSNKHNGNQHKHITPLSTPV